MNCSEFEKRIYLYRELTVKEKEFTDKHIAHCESCSALATRLFQQQEMVRKISSVKPMVTDPEWLTQRIMNSVQRKDKRTSYLDSVASFLNSLLVRYAFSVLSIALMAFFYVEQQASEQTKIVAKVEITQGAILNTGSFLRSHLNSRQRREQVLSISRYTYNRSERFSKTL
jgi:predicted anti-sigma-YlaC factor YlaD